MTGTILVVDDLLPNIKLLEAKLNAEYYNVLTAKSGKEALDLLEKEQVDLILLDVMMPEMDGFEVCRKIKSSQKLMGIPVIMVTALNEVEDRVTGLQAGADDFLTKPINEVILIARIKSLLRLKSIIDEFKIRGDSLMQLGVEASLFTPDAIVLNGANVILVDDDLAQSKQINKVLGEKQANIKVITDPINIIQDIKDFKTDVVILSTQMFNHDILRICSQIKTNKETKFIPILLIIDEDEMNILVKGFELGINDYIQTPIESIELVTRTNTQVKKKKYQDNLVSLMENTASMAVKDALTGVYNRRYLDMHAKKMIEKNPNNYFPVIIGMADIDFFKKVNDNYGHLAGDEVLKTIAKILVENLRITDLVVRLGGEEFLIILSNTTLEDGEKTFDRIRHNIESTLIKTSDGKEIKVTSSFGLTKFNNGEDFNLAIERADKGLYKSKENGRNRVTIEDPGGNLTIQF